MSGFVRRREAAGIYMSQLCYTGPAEGNFAYVELGIIGNRLSGMQILLLQ
jgi:hypothetical protein